MDRRRRRELARYGAPAAFLAAVTIAVLLIKAGLSGKSQAQPTVGAIPTASSTTTATARPTARITVTTATPTTRAYTVQSGDTLGSIAAKEQTTVDELLRLNPGIDPKTLHVGQQIRVG